MKSLSLAAVLLLTPLARADGPLPARPLTLRAADGEAIPVAVLEPHTAARRAPTAVLVHGLTRSKDDWLTDAWPTFGGAFTEALRARGYRVYVFDARFHGGRDAKGLTPKQRVKQAHAGDAAAYREMIAGTVRDTLRVIEHALEGDPARPLLLAGYSMGAQVAMLAAAEDPRVDALVTMVPPHVEPAWRDAAPVHAAPRLAQRWLLLTARDDTFSTAEQSRALFALAPGKRKSHETFDGGHALPRAYLDAVGRWLDAQR